MNNNNATGNLRAFLRQIWGGIGFLIGVVTSLLGFIKLGGGDLGLFTLILMVVGILALLLTCIYYVWFWKPESEDHSPEIWIPDSDERELAQQVKERRRKKVRLLARLGLFVIPILTVTGVAIYQYYISLPSKDFIILVAKFDGPKPQEYRITETIIENLENATEEYSHVKIKALEKSLNNSDNAKKEGKLQKATLVIWGWYGKTKEKVPISVNFEILKSLPELPELGREARGQVQTLAVAQLESFKLQTRLSQEMAYLSLFTLGMYRYLEEDWNKAVNRFSKALESLKSVEDPVTALGQGVIYLYLGNSYYYQGEYQQAISDYDRAIQINPQDAEAYYNRGLAYGRQGEYQQAISDFDQAIQLNPQYAEAYNNRGVAYYYQGEYQQAISDYDQAIQINPQDAEAYYNRGLAYGRQGEYQQAISDYTKLIELTPSFAEAYALRGIVYHKLGNYTAALLDYKKVLALDQKYLLAIVNIGLIKYEQGSIDEATRQWQQAVKINPDFTEPKLALAVALYIKGEQERAFEMAEAALKLDRKFGKLEYLKKNLWGNRLLADAEELLSTPRIEGFLISV